MVHFSAAILLATAAASVQGLPLTKRIAQTISASTAKWEQACIAAGGAQQCNPISVTAFSTLLAAAGPCEQQNSADAMVDLAKSLGNDADMIRLAQIFAQQPRNTPTSLSVQYCQQAPKNAELNGLFQCQFAGANPTTFVGGVAVGQQGTIPFDLSAPLSPAGSCPANPNGPVPDGQQLADIAQSPGNVGSGNAGNNGTNGGNGNASGNNGSANGNNGENTGNDSDNGDNAAATSSAPPDAAPTATASTGGDFKVKNGQDAQAQNAQFASLTADSPCQEGEQACIDGGFAQCVGGRFVIATCSASTKCFSLPLVNKAGTSLACTTGSDAAARISASGATGGVTGNGAAGNKVGNNNNAGNNNTGNNNTGNNNTGNNNTGNNANSSSTGNNAATSTPAQSNGSSTAGGSFKAQNGRDAQALNAQFASLTPSSSCQDGAQACVDGAFAQCVGGKFVLSPCAATLTCAALPLVNKPGTSITCTTQADADARIATAIGA
ncbi:hypothetical protein BDN71DRAFT_1441801 [Pleurotus eryngii]|uniref:Carbohydrate-binding module family 19 domain-containing protein n=1 Tax=Pleurotus eryngii TaxID=5323 RepID=A0A9P6DIP3_PLEER|nr:hypothetical protein BDN71DRAFT_1441801 [Pleurotus eryngii]